MRFGTFSILVGDSSCNAKCPYCVSKVTPQLNVNKCKEINWRNFNIACKLAEANQIQTAILTGKGEPLLFPKRINVLTSGKFGLLNSGRLKSTAPVFRMASKFL